MEPFNQETKYQRAKERVEAIRKFYTDLLKYSIFISILIIIYYFYFRWFRYWMLWIAFGWGIGLIFKAFKAFDMLPFLNKKWEDQKIKEIMDDEEESTQNRWN